MLTLKLLPSWTLKLKGEMQVVIHVERTFAFKHIAALSITFALLFLHSLFDHTMDEDETSFFQFSGTVYIIAQLHD